MQDQEWLEKTCFTIFTSPIIHFVDPANRSFSVTLSAALQLLGIKESFSMWKEFNSHRIFSHKHGRRFVVLYTNMAAVTSCENDLLSSISLGATVLPRRNWQQISTHGVNKVYFGQWNWMVLTIQFNLKIVWTQSKYYSMEYLSVKRTKQV